MSPAINLCASCKKTQTNIQMKRYGAINGCPLTFLLQLLKQQLKWSTLKYALEKTLKTPIQSCSPFPFPNSFSNQIISDFQPVTKSFPIPKDRVYVTFSHSHAPTLFPFTFQQTKHIFLPPNTTYSTFH